ncbi:AMP-dependent synthetase [Mycolicibacterium fortuitum]|uniref:AMP-dependent synthetase n=2 Tax=Mycolicibacterium fortuitum TaxID=1766 RepID=A0ABD6QCG6_MYCFO|nr:AMP-dependent synthetase [Mycolicibacterium fortuitum]
MGSVDEITVGDPLDAATIPEAFQRVVARYGDRVGLRTIDESVCLTWAQFGDRVREIAGGLAGLGIDSGCTVAMLLPNTIDCHLIDYAAYHIGAIPFAIFNSSSTEQIEYQLRKSDTTVVFTEQSFLDRVRPALAALDGQIEHLVVTDGPGGLSMADVVARVPPNFDFDARWRAVQADDVSNLIFTSGTTGIPKGAHWAHRTVLAQQRALDEAFPPPRDSVISFLPLAHAGGRITSLYRGLGHGAAITVCPSMAELPVALAAHRPDVLFGVPRVWEKLRVGIEALIAAEPDADARRAMEQAIEIGTRRTLAAEVGSSAMPAEVAELTAAHQRTLGALAAVLRRVGLDRIKVAFIGGAPSAPELSTFFRSVGVPLLEAYGSTEASLDIFNRIDEYKTGTAGRPLPGVEARCADDGELLVRSAMNFIGYRGAAGDTASTIDEDGWLHTGDIAVIDDDGFVAIVDRKKELIINSAGKNMSPAYIESTIKGESSLIGQLVAVGDRRKYVTALITLDAEALRTAARRLGLTDLDYAELAGAEAIRAEVDAAVDRGNRRLNSNEQVKKYHLINEPWLPDSDVLTPTAKLRRKAIYTKYADEIEDLYAE